MIIKIHNVCWGGIFMKEEKNIKFAELLKKRSLLSEAKKKNTKIISSSDSQLMEILKNFNESKDYKSSLC